MDIRLEPRPADSFVPLTTLQSQLWKHIVNHEGSLSMRMCVAMVRVSGALNISLLQRSIEALIRRHESLRTRFVVTDSVLRQQIDVAHKYELDVLDLSHLPSAHAEKEAISLAQEFIDKRIDFLVEPLFEAKLFRLSDRDHVLGMALHHIVSDAWSCAILYKETWILYNQAVQGLPFSLPELPVQFADYAVWQQRTYDLWLEKHEAYWRGHFAGAPRIQVPLSNISSKRECPVIEILHCPFGKDLSVKLRDLARRERTLLPLIALSIYVVTLLRWCNRSGLSLLFASHGRHRPELKNMIGLLVTHLPLRIELMDEDSPLDFLKRVHLEFYSACNHQAYDRVPDLIPECPLDLYFNWPPSEWSRGAFQEEKETPQQLKMKPFPVQQSKDIRVGAKYESLIAWGYDTDAGIVMSMLYRADLIEVSTMEWFGKQLRLFANEFAHRPFAPVASVALAT
jgi:hypothetical protein